MTVCIAGVCCHDEKPAMVLIADSQGTYGNALKSNDANKIRNVGRFRILISDNPTSADELITLISPTLIAFDKGPQDFDSHDVRVSSLMAELRQFVRQRKRAIVEHHIGLTFSSSLDEFRVDAQKWLSEREHKEAWDEIRRLDLGCSLIIGHVSEAPTLIGISPEGHVSLHDHYCVTGSGMDAALALLVQTSYEDLDSVFDCLVHLHLAKSMAEKNAFVGDESTIEILTNSSSPLVLTDEGWDYVREFTIANIIENLEIKFEKGYLGKTRSGEKKAAH